MKLLYWGLLVGLLLVIIVLTIFFCVHESVESFHLKRHPEIYTKISFPEDVIPVPREYQELFKEKVMKGTEMASESRIVIVITFTKDEDYSHLGIALKRWIWLAEAFSDYVIIFSDVSHSEKTKHTLNKATKENEKLINQPNPDNYARLNYSDWDWMLTIDPSLRGPVSRVGMLHALSLFDTDEAKRVSGYCIQEIPYTFGLVTILSDKNNGIGWFNYPSAHKNIVSRGGSAIKTTASTNVGLELSKISDTQKGNYLIDPSWYCFTGK